MSAPRHYDFPSPPKPSGADSAYSRALDAWWYAIRLTLRQMAEDINRLQAGKSVVPHDKFPADPLGGTAPQTTQSKAINTKTMAAPKAAPATSVRTSDSGNRTDQEIPQTDL